MPRSQYIVVVTPDDMHTNVRMDRDPDTHGRLVDEDTEAELDDVTGLQIDGEVSARWRQVGSSHGLTTDTQIASFLLDQYVETTRGDAVKPTTPHCTRCDAPLMLVCVNCHLRSLPGNEASTGIQCTPASSFVERLCMDKTSPDFVDIQTEHHPPVFVPPSKGKGKPKFFPEVKQETEVENSNDVENSDMLTSTDTSSFNSTVFTAHLSGAKFAEKMASGPLGSTASSTHLNSRKMVSNGYTDKNSHKISRSLKHRQTVKVSSNGRKRGRARKIVQQAQCTGRQSQQDCILDSDVTSHGDHSVQNTAVTVLEPALMMGTDSLNPLMLTPPSAQLRRGRCEHKRVKDGQQSDASAGSGSLKDDREQVDREASNCSANTVQPFSKPGKKRGPRPKPRQVHPCTQCDKEFPTGSRLREHMKCHTGRDKPYKCPHCGKGCVSKSQLAIHVRSHTGDRPFACSECDKSYCTKAALTAHVRCHTGERPFVCEQCGASFRRKENLKFHSRLHTGARPFVCPQCGWAFALRENLYRHRLTHTGVKPYSCKECGSTFTSRYGLKQHGMIHANQKPVGCTMCEARFRTKSQLKKHLVTHTGVRPFRCTECDAAFAFSKALSLHMRTHTGEKPFSCEQCEYRCARASTLAVHRRKHTGEKPYACKVCGLAFRLSEERTVHMDMVHTGERKHICHECGVAYFRHQYLTDHKRRKHRQK